MLEIYKKTQKESLCIYDCEIGNYKDILSQQHDLVEQRHKNKIPNTVLTAEHFPVITLGVREKCNEILMNQKELENRNIDIVKTHRGGSVTAHNPGQLVFYPIINLKDFNLGISEYIRKLEQIGIELLSQLGINAARKKGFPGLWVGQKKIAFIGVRVSKSVTYHGMAINIQNDLSIFDYIVACGLEGVEITSVLKESGTKNSMRDIKEKLCKLLIKYFSKDKQIVYEYCA